MKLLIFLLFSFVSLHAYEVYIDSNNSLKLEEIITKKVVFKERNNLFFGHTDAQIWIKFKVKNPTNSVQNHTLHINNPLLQSINFYELEDNSLKTYKNGYLIPLKERMIPSVDYLFQTKLAALQEKTIYISAYSKSFLDLRLMHFTNLRDFYSNSFKDNVLTTALLSILVAFLIFNTIIYLINLNFFCKPLYLYYILYLTIYIFMQLQYSNYISLFVDFQNNHYLIFNVSLSAVIIFLFLFFREILQVRKKFKYFNYLIMGLIILHATVLMSFFIHDTFLLHFRNVFLVPLGFLILGTAIIHAMRHKILYSKYLFASWFLVIFCTSCIVLKQSTNLNLAFIDNLFLGKGLLIAAIIETTIFSVILALKIQHLKEEDSLKGDLLQSKTKGAQMGEMIGMIAHQWRQPLSAINAEATTLLVQMELDTYQEKDLRKHLRNTLGHIDFLSETINDFRSFFKKDTIPKITTVNKAIQKALNITQSTFYEHHVSIDKQWKSEQVIKLYLNELTQVILNLLKNAEDNFQEKDIKNPKIFISTVDYDNFVEIRVCDNGGGIDKDHIETIFDQEFSTKDESIGTGLGLYMSKLIVEEHHNGKIYAENNDNGVCFIIKLPF